MNYINEVFSKFLSKVKEWYDEAQLKKQRKSTVNLPKLRIFDRKHTSNLDLHSTEDSFFFSPRNKARIYETSKKVRIKSSFNINKFKMNPSLSKRIGMRRCSSDSQIGTDDSLLDFLELEKKVNNEFSEIYGEEEQSEDRSEGISYNTNEESDCLLARSPNFSQNQTYQLPIVKKKIRVSPMHRYMLHSTQMSMDEEESNNISFSLGSSLLNRSTSPEKSTSILNKTYSKFEESLITSSPVRVPTQDSGFQNNSSLSNEDFGIDESDLKKDSLERKAQDNGWTSKHKGGIARWYSFKDMSS